MNCFVSASGERYDFVLHVSNDPRITEVFIRTRALGFCAGIEVQELARIIIVDDVSRQQMSIADHRPILDYPPYNKPYTNDIVRMLYINSIRNECRMS